MDSGPFEDRQERHRKLVNQKPHVSESRTHLTLGVKPRDDIWNSAALGTTKPSASNPDSCRRDRRCQH